MMSDLGMPTSITIRTDSSSAKSILSREGCGKVKHLEARQLWMQEKVRNKDILIEKVPIARNPSDVLTHAWTGPEGAAHFPNIGMKFNSGFTGTHLLNPRGCVSHLEEVV